MVARGGRPTEVAVRVGRGGATRSRGSSTGHGWCAAAVWPAAGRRARRLKTIVKEEDVLLSHGPWPTLL
jgi:hypothetical protein